MVKKKVHYAWLIAVGCCFMQAGGMGAAVDGLGVFYTPVITDLNIGLGTLTLYITLSFFAAAACYPIIGRIFPKYNCNIVLTCASLLVIGSTAAMSFFTQAWQWWLAGIVQGIGGSLMFLVASTVLIGNWFDKKRGLVMGITQCFSGVGTIVFSMAGNAAINAFGWRAAYLLYALGMAIVVLPWTLFVFRFKPEDKGLLPYGYDPSKQKKDALVYPGVDAKKALATGAFWAIFIFSGIECLFGGYNAHLPGFIVSIGLSDSFGASVLSISMVGYIVFMIILGWLTDKVGPYIPTFITIAVIAISLIGFCYARTPVPLAVFGFFFGINSVVVCLCIPTIIMDVFGQKDYTKIVSYTRMSQLIAAFGSSAVGFCYDITGSFNTAFIAGVVILAMCALLIIFVIAKRKSIKERLWVYTTTEKEQGVEDPLLDKNS